MFILGWGSVSDQQTHKKQPDGDDQPDLWRYIGRLKQYYSNLNNTIWNDQSQNKNQS